MLHEKTVLVRRRHFYVKNLLFYKLNGCKNTLQKYIIYLSGFDKRNLQKFQVRFNNLTIEVNKKQLKVAS